MVYQTFDSAAGDSGWYSVNNAIDGDTTPDASTNCKNTGGWEANKYLTLTLTTPITSAKMALYTSGFPVTSANALWIIETSTNGTDWVEKYNGSVLNGWVNGWQEISYTEQTVKAIRIKRQDSDADPFYVQEAKIDNAGGAGDVPCLLLTV